MSLTYATWVSSLANMLVVPSTDANFVAMLPNVRLPDETFAVKD